MNTYNREKVSSGFEVTLVRTPPGKEKHFLPPLCSHLFSFNTRNNSKLKITKKVMLSAVSLPDNLAP